MWRTAVAVALSVVWTAALGCSYPKHRFQDSAEMFDFGVTFSKKPQFSAYVNCPVVAPLGYGKVDGQFVGVGGGKVGMMEHHQESSGLLVWGREEVSWDTFDPENADTLSVQGVGLLGLADREEGDDPYEVACIHYLHLGWVGVTANIHWLEIPDFLLGIFFLDPMRDDGEDGGYWFWGGKTVPEDGDAMQKPTAADAPQS